MPSKKPKSKRPGAGAAHILAAQKLQESGLNLDEDAKLLGMEVLTADQTARLSSSFEAFPALKIRYFRPDGTPMPPWPKHPAFYRLRYFPPSGFGEKTQRYTQLPNTPCCAYFPQNVNWVELLADINQPIIFTEGELKAACATKYDCPTIGLGGVYNWKSSKFGVEFLPELEAIDWVGRRVFICFDSDYSTNPMVCAALRDFADQLIDRGAFVNMVTLPKLAEEGKTGLDDFIVAEGVGAFEKMLQTAQPIGLTVPLFNFNKKYIYIKHPGLIMTQNGHEKVAPDAFKGHLESSKTYIEQALKPDGSISHKQVSAAATWINWPLRQQAEKITYMPGKPKIIEDVNHYNTWPGWGLQPKKGDVKPFMQLLEHLFQGAEAQAMDWFLKWCAYPIQYPGAKLFTSSVFHGVTQGTGKSLVGYTLGWIYGKNFVEISQADLHNGFNEWAEGKQFVMGDDVTGSNKREDNDILKKLITQKEMRVNIKYVPSYTIPDCINYFFTSNHPDAFFLEDTDRRFFIHEVMVDPMKEEFYTFYAGRPGQPETSWLHKGGAAAVFDYLLKLPLGAFNPSAAAYKTEARARLISDGQSDLGAWVRKLRALPDQVLKVGEVRLSKDLYTNYELLKLYDPLGNTKTTANGLGRELKRASIRQVLKGNMVQLPTGPHDRYYAVRNVEKWVKASHGECVKHIMAGVQQPVVKKVKF